jgi:transcriptional regulator with XRE-family HTH domain
MITGEQVKAARELLRWTKSDLAGRIGVSSTSVRHIERADKETSRAMVRAAVAELEAAGVEFPEGEPPRLKSAPPK